MADFKLDRIRFKWKNQWSPTTAYIKDEIVEYAGSTYVCRVGHTSAASFDIDFGTLDQEVYVTVGRNAADTGNIYYFNGVSGQLNPEITLKKGLTYVFNQDDQTNVYFPNANGGTPNPHPMFFSKTEDGTLVNSGFRFEDGVKYYINHTEVTGDNYVANFNTAHYREIRITVPLDATPFFFYCHFHTGMGNDFNVSNEAVWEKQIDGQVYKNDWTVGTIYDIGDIVVYNGYIYKCINRHTSTSIFNDGLESESQNWHIISEQDSYKGTWVNGTRYRPNDVVKNNATLYRCITGHVSAATTDEGIELDLSKWEIAFQAFNYLQDHNAGINYKVNDIVKKGSSIWKCVTQHISASPPNFPSELSNWNLYLEGMEFENQWDAVVEYQIGDVVDYGGYGYRALVNNVNVKPQATDTATWQQVYENFDHKGDYNYDSSQEYKVGDVVRHNGYLYVAILDNEDVVEPPSATHWEVVVPGRQWRGQWADQTEYKLEDLATYGSNTYICTVKHISTTGKRPDTDSVTWNLHAEGKTSNVLTTRGDLITYTNDVAKLNKQRFARGNEGQVLRVQSTGLDWQDLDLIADVFYVHPDGIDNPERGKSLNSPYKTIKYACDQIRANPTYRDSINYTAIDNALELSASANAQYATDAPNLKAVLESNNARTSNPYGDLSGSGAIVAGDAALWISWYEAFIDGTTTWSGTQAQEDAGRDLWNQLNRTFDTWKNETFTQVGGLGTTFNAKVQTLKESTVIVKTGIYKETLPIIVPEGCAIVGDELRSTVIQPEEGYESTKMFYVRNASGIRNLTMEGLFDILTVDNAYFTKRPVNDVAYVSLDPGTGPTDESVWIKTRSPYIQNVTTIGTGCTGLKIDGDLHNGGNDSIVANDFTQVLSDGIGVWCTNLGRTELVSVFTYYNHIGYLAENGGKIRGTNGNNSYGKYGSVAEGVDNTETPITASLNNRAGQAIVSDVVTDGNQVLTVEYANAGEGYDASTTYTVTGAGTGAASTTANTRDGGIFQIRLTGTGLLPLGTGYLQLQGNAQDGGSLGAGTMILSGADINTFANYDGMRIVIISGAGAGQYGYITAFDNVSKQVTVAKESDDSAGWQHFTGATLVQPDSTSRYQIEPRVVIDDPTSGTTAFVRLAISGGGLNQFKIIEPGSGYESSSPPTVTITDPNATSPGVWEVRIGNGVLAQPTWSNRGTGYQSAFVATVSGAGYADEYPIGSTINVTGLSLIPGPGANLEFAGTDTLFAVVEVSNITGTAPNFTATLAITPYLKSNTTQAHATAITIRESYSQVRLTGHDFLDIGTGNASDTEYPSRYIFGYDSANEPSQPNEAVDSGGGRVFYTSTDQDGNFRVGELFKVEQATGVITLNADDFQLSGLTELRLGGVSLGGTSAVVREFSTDGALAANSDNIVPTQKALATFIEAQIGGGGADVVVSGLLAGQTNILNQDEISSPTGVVNFEDQVNFTDGILGDMLKAQLFLNGNG
jgi:hypothetical protein